MPSEFTVERSQKLLGYLIANPELLDRDQQTAFDLLEVISILENHNSEQLAALALRQEHRHRVVLTDVEEAALEVTVSRCRHLHQLVETAKDVIRQKELQNREQKAHEEYERHRRIAELERLDRLQKERDEEEREARMRIEREREMQYRQESRGFSPSTPVSPNHQQPAPPPPPTTKDQFFNNENEHQQLQKSTAAAINTSSSSGMVSTPRNTATTANTSTVTTSSTPTDMLVEKNVAALKGSSRAYPEGGQRWQSPDRRPYEGHETRTVMNREEDGGFFALRPSSLNEEYSAAHPIVQKNREQFYQQQQQQQQQPPVSYSLSRPAAASVSADPLIQSSINDIMRERDQERNYEKRKAAESAKIPDDVHEIRDEQAFRREVANVVRFADGKRQVPPSTHAERNFYAPPPPPPSNLFRMQQNQHSEMTARSASSSSQPPSSSQQNQQPRYISGQVFSDPYLPRRRPSSPRRRVSFSESDDTDNEISSHHQQQKRTPLASNRPRTLREVERASGVPLSRIRAANPKLENWDENDLVPDHINIYVPLAREDVSGDYYYDRKDSFTSSGYPQPQNRSASSNSGFGGERALSPNTSHRGYQNVRRV